MTTDREPVDVPVDERPDFLRELGELETVDLPGIEILSSGGPYFGTGSPPEGDTFTDRDLQALADANTALAGQVKAPIKIGHGKAQRLLRNSGLASRTDLSDDEQPAAGWLENFRVSGGKLVADARAVPRKIADLMQTGAFRSRSVEMARVTEQTPTGAGRTFDSVVTALALLGAKAPAVRTLDDVLAWYGEAGTARELLLADEEDAPPEDVDRALAVGDVVWDSEQGASDYMEDLCDALNGGDSSTSEVAPRFVVRDVSMDGNRALVSEGYGDDATGWVVPFAIVDGDPVPAPMSEWTLATQAWLEAATPTSGGEMSDSSDPDVATSSTGADTSDMSDENTATATLTDDQVVSFAAAFGINEDDPAARRDAVLAQFRTFAGETPAPAPPTPPDSGEPAPPTPPPSATEDEDPRIAALEQRAALGERAYEERRIERREASIALATRQGRIDPAQHDRWREFMDRDYDLAVEALASIPVQPRGRAFGSDDPARVEFAEQTVKGYDAAYGNLAAGLGITPHSLPVPATGGQS